jgi:hypothetical protein
MIWVNLLPSREKNTEKTRTTTTSLYNYAAIDFCSLLKNTPLGTIYQDDIDQLQRDDLIWHVRDYRQNQHTAAP